MEQDTSSSITPVQSPSKLNQVFYNDHGLRAGWRLLIYFAMILALFASAQLLTKRLAGGAASGVQLSPMIQAVFQLVGELIIFLIMLFLAWVMSRIEHQRMGVYGLPLKRPAVSRFIQGYFIWGFLPLAVLLCILRFFHAFFFGYFTTIGVHILGWGLLWFCVFLLVGFSEEYLFRGYFLYTLSDGIGFWPAAIIQALLFARVHMGNGGETRVGIIATAFFAIFAAATLWRTGNLWLAVGAHAGWDWGQSYFFGVNDSGFQAPGHLLNPHIGAGADWLTGGTVGPEGSVVTLILWALMAVIFLVVYRKRSEPALLIMHNQKY